MNRELARRVCPKMRSPARIAIVAFALGAAGFAHDAQADDAAANRVLAKTIADRMLAHDPFAFEGAELRARLALIDASGKTQERAFEAKSKRGDDGLVRTLVRFVAPQSIAGTAFLMIERAGATDEEYVYLPRMKSTRRVGGTAEKDGSFMGSDFTYADLERKDLKNATFAKSGEEPIGNDLCDKLDATPRGASRYAHVEVWIRKSDALPLKIRWFGKDGQADKTLSVRRVRIVDGKPVIVESVTESAKSGHRTELTIDEVKLRSDIPDAELTPAALSH